MRIGAAFRGNQGQPNFGLGGTKTWPARIADNEAHTSLILLLRFAIFVRDHWDELVVGPKKVIDT